MFVRRFRNGDLLVMTGGRDENGVMWDGLRRLAKGTSEHDGYEAALQRNGQEVPTMSEEEDQMASEEVGGGDLGAIEQALREFGADLEDGSPPDQVIVWKSAQVRKAEAGLEDRYWRDGTVWFAGNCMADTGPGNRAAVYETRGSGIVGFFDFNGYAGRREGQAYRHMAAGVYRPLDEPVPLDRLQKAPALGHLFARRQGKAALTYEEGHALAALIGDLPLFVSIPLPEWAEEAEEPFEWEDDGIARDPNWASEHELHMRLASMPRLFKQFGFKKPPEIEVRSEDWTCRYDIVSRAVRVVVEVKLHADKAALDQMERYLDTLAREWGGGQWQAHIVAEVCDTALRRAVRKRGGVTLWECDRSAQRLVRLD